MGYPGSGKTSATEFLATENDGQQFAIGDVVRDIAREELGPDADSDDIGEWVTAQLEESDTAIIEQFVQRLEEQNLGDYVYLDGVRTVTDYEYLSDHFDEFTLVYVDTEFETRLDRLQERGREGEDEFSPDDLENRDAREDDWGVRDLREGAYYDVKLTNDGTLEEFEDKLSSLPLGDKGQRSERS